MSWGLSDELVSIKWSIYDHISYMIIVILLYHIDMIWAKWTDIDRYIYVMIILNLRYMLKREAPFKFFLPGHCWSLHAWVCVKSSVENSQPVKHDLDLVISPLPQNFEQVDHSLHNDNCIPIDISFISSNMVVAFKATFPILT